MRHSLHAENFGVRLRPVQMSDAAFIVWLRNQDYVKGRVGDSATDVDAQEVWLKKYFEREGDYYFIAETPGGIPLGTHGIYDLQGTSAEKGRQIIRAEVMGAGVPAAILATDLAFGQLGLSELRSNSVSTNFNVHSLHRKFGFKQVGILRAARTIDGQPVDLVQFLLTAEDWFTSPRSFGAVGRCGRNAVREWEKTPSARNQPWLEFKTRN